jgi:hypothetical protein
MKMIMKSSRVMSRAWSEGDQWSSWFSIMSGAWSSGEGGSMAWWRSWFHSEKFP